ncbi:stage III sporulation protein AF [Clostridium sp. 'deep sea']|uniref:stage III sporulation protein AF n=1 Tax=Clostridium sp. 'deep sea' TaxID=2779445 RepID=UPI00189653B6|nr:stage III sporulation protein AF [Clostridium sp. 'deep sea']QOR35854.1 stage III sporulation protein AF [Clostridium sp. 'deep sea']
MLSFIESWLSNLIVVIFLITMVKLIMPSGKIKSYIRFVLSLVVMLLIVQPVVEAVKGSDFLVNSWMQHQKNFEFQENRVYAMSQTLNNNEDAVNLYKQKIIERLENDLSILTNNTVTVTNLVINEDSNSKEFGYIQNVSIKVMQSSSEDTAEVMAVNENTNTMHSEIKKWLTTNFGKEVNLKISLESEG